MDCYCFPVVLLCCVAWFVNAFVNSVDFYSSLLCSLLVLIWWFGCVSAWFVLCFVACLRFCGEWFVLVD